MQASEKIIIKACSEPKTFQDINNLECFEPFKNADINNILKKLVSKNLLIKFFSGKVNYYQYQSI